jgi:hypothetical protein
MKIAHSIAAAMAVFLSPLPAVAAIAHHAPHRAGFTCLPGLLGCPPVNATPVPAPVPTPSGPVPAKDIFSGLLQIQPAAVAALVQADTYEASPLNAATGAATNVYAHECLAGMPAIGTPGQTGYIPAAPGLIAWVKGLSPLAASTVPPLPGPNSAMCLADKAASPNPASTALDCTAASPATIAVFADNQLMAAEGTVNTILTTINAGGIQALTTNGQAAMLDVSCGAMINHVSNEIITATAQATAFEALIAKYVMPLMAAEKAGH